MTLRTTIVFTLCATLMLCSCKSKRTEPVAPEISAQRLPLPTLYRNLENQYTSWNDFYCPVNLKMEAPISMSISGRATMVRDSLIHFSLRVLGMEAAVININSDSLWIVDKYHKFYIAEPLGKVLSRYPITIGNIQDLLLGHPFVPGEKTMPISTDSLSTEVAGMLSLFTDPEAPEMNGRWAIMPNDANKIDWWCTATEDSVPQLSTMSFGIGEEGQLDCIYLDPIETEKGPVASEVDIYAFLPSIEANAQINWKLKNVKWDIEKTPAFSVPKNCEKVDLQMLLDLFQQLAPQ